MRRIDVLASPTVMEAIQRALSKTKTGTMVRFEGSASGPGVSQPAWYRGAHYMADVERQLLQVVVADGAVDVTIQAICDVAHEFKAGEIEVTVTPLDDVIRIRSTPLGVRVD